MLAGTYNSNTGSFVAVINGTVYTVGRDHHNYKLLLEKFKKGEEDQFDLLYRQELKKEDVLMPKAVAGTSVTFENGELKYNGKPVHHSYASRIVEAYENGFPIQPMLNFFENLMQNPSSRSVEELPDFLMNRNLPVTEDGCFLAYKSVRSDWYSKASGNLTLLQGKVNSSGNIYNAVGEVIECVRNEVDDERVNECSHGLHVGGLAYSGPNGWYHSANDKVVIVKVNPKDVVSVPRDHNAQKVRVCRYEVVEEYKEPLSNDYHDVEKEEYELVPEDLDYMDTVTFQYMGKNDQNYVQRYMIVEEIGEDYLFGTLLMEDPSYEEGNESRKFLFDNILDGSIEMYEVSNDDYFAEVE